MSGAIARAVERAVFVVGYLIVQEGAPTEAMYFIQGGQVEVFMLKSTERITTLGPGSFFGEIGYLSQDGRSGASVRVVENVECLMLVRNVMQDLEAAHPKFRQWLEAIARLRLANTTAGQRLTGRRLSGVRFPGTSSTNIGLQVNYMSYILLTASLICS